MEWLKENAERKQLRLFQQKDPPILSNKVEKAKFCKINLYEPNCKEYLDTKLNSIRNPKCINQNNYSEAYELKKFADLKKKGIVSEEEFN